MDGVVRGALGGLEAQARDRMPVVVEAHGFDLMLSALLAGPADFLGLQLTRGKRTSFSKCTSEIDGGAATHDTRLAEKIRRFRIVMIKE